MPAKSSSASKKKSTPRQTRATKAVASAGRPVSGAGTNVEFNLTSADLGLPVQAAAILDVDESGSISDNILTSAQRRQKRARQEKEVDKLLQWESDNVRFLKKKKELQLLQIEREKLTVEIQQLPSGSGTWQVTSNNNSSNSVSDNLNFQSVNPAARPTALPARSLPSEASGTVHDRDSPALPAQSRQPAGDSTAVPKGPPGLPVPGSAADSPADDASPSNLGLSDLRKLTELQGTVDSRMKLLGWQAAAALEPLTESIKGKSKPSSGRAAKPESYIVKEIIWPHSAIEVQYTGSTFSYEQLDFPLLAAGEINIVLDPKVSSEERGGRLQLLKAIAYYSRNRSWSEVKNLHNAVLTQIEQNHRSWENIQFAELASSVFLANTASNSVKSGLAAQSGPARFPSKGKTFPKSRGRAASGPASFSRANPFKVDRFFCSDFNQGLCPHRDAHVGRLGESEKWLEHFCATCYLDFEEFNLHAETSGCSRYDPAKPRKYRK
jgi:hypothetical protein